MRSKIKSSGFYWQIPTKENGKMVNFSIMEILTTEWRKLQASQTLITIATQ